MAWPSVTSGIPSTGRHFIRSFGPLTFAAARRRISMAAVPSLLRRKCRNEGRARGSSPARFKIQCLRASQSTRPQARPRPVAGSMKAVVRNGVSDGSTTNAEWRRGHQMRSKQWNHRSHRGSRYDRGTAMYTGEPLVQSSPLMDKIRSRTSLRRRLHATPLIALRA
jgi:hypothetical protein